MADGPDDHGPMISPVDTLCGLDPLHGMCIFICVFLMLFMLLYVLGFHPEVPLGLVYYCLYVISGFPGFFAGRGFDPAVGAPGGG
ncbi:hypothetical protein F511_31795 [Dorcoceras hygrometricum]|uniref:Transmembrane protein n=1 Tax=Dorcoceras hygrometricum TaxID=472368 RepID=A0A2Z7D4E5_9LAMI|nr:hypothetical protein F511_31795 [Dorcoceras hygrometricum]